MLSTPTQEQKRRLITAMESGKITKQAAKKIKVMLENGDLWHQVRESIDNETTS